MTNTATFATVGVSTKNNSLTKFRFTNRGAEGYGDILIKEGHTNVLFMDLAEPMTKADAVAAFVAQYPQHADVRMPGAGAAERAEKGERKPRAKAAKLTPEQVAAAKLAAKRARDAAAKREKRAAGKAADTAEADSTNKLDAALAALDEAMNDGADAPVADTVDAAETADTAETV
jgi:hypothetical protein